MNEEYEWPIEVTSLTELAQRQMQSQHIPHKHDHIRIIWLKFGGGMLELDLKCQRLKESRMYFIAPGKSHFLEIGENAEGYVISFPEALLYSGGDDFELFYRCSLLHLLGHLPAIKIDQGSEYGMDNIIRMLMREMQQEGLLRYEMMEKLSAIFLICLARQLEGVIRPALDARSLWLMKNFVELLNANYITWKQVKDYARALAVTPGYLNKTVKDISGFCASHHIRQRIVQEAKRQAICSGSNMKEIAYQLGFVDVSHFSKFFKNVHGRNFSDFRDTALR